MISTPQRDYDEVLSVARDADEKKNQGCLSTVEFWLRIAPNTNFYPSIFRLAPDEVTNRFGGWVNCKFPGEPNLFWNFGDIIRGGRLKYNSAASVGVWHHFAFVASQSAARMKVFLDGFEE